jgi:hypothetical protein
MMRVYLRELFAAILLYLAALFISIFLLFHLWHYALLWRTLCALIPVPTLFAVCWVVIRQMRRCDEMHLRLGLESLAFAFAGTALVTLTYGFLELVGYPRLSMFWVWGVMAVLWNIGYWIAYRRLR